MCFSRNSVGVSGHCDFRDIQKSIFSCVYWAIASYCLQSPLYCRGGELRNHNSLVCWCVFTLTNVTFFIQVRSAPIILQLEQRLPSRLLTKKKRTICLSAPAGSWQKLSAASLRPASRKPDGTGKPFNILFLSLVPVHLCARYVDGRLCWGRGSAVAEQSVGSLPPEAEQREPVEHTWLNPHGRTIIEPFKYEQKISLELYFMQNLLKHSGWLQKAFWSHC